MTTETTSKGRRRAEPQRTCVACRRVGDQPSFVRLVRTADGTVHVDEGRRRQAGRGAYLCRQATCWERGVRGAIAAAFRAPIIDEDREALRTYADRFTADMTPTAPGGQSGTESEGA
jgi:uncharacterized protein